MKTSEILREIKGILDYSVLNDIILFTNTPSYLFINFRMNASIQAIRDKFLSKDLVKCFQHLIRKGVENSREYICAYGILVAIMLKEPVEVIGFFEKLDKYKIRWAGELKCMFFSSIKSTTLISKSLDYNISSSYNTTSSSSNQIIITDSN